MLVSRPVDMRLCKLASESRLGIALALAGYMGVCQNKGPQYRPPNTIVLVIGPPKKVFLRNPHMGRRECLDRKLELPSPEIPKKASRMNPACLVLPLFHHSTRVSGGNPRWSCNPTLCPTSQTLNASMRGREMDCG